jgi:Mn2+/Fe2+ NRAMP family transporter
VIGLFIVVTCAATLHSQGIEIDSAADAAGSLEPLAGGLARSLFGIGFVGAALLAIAIVPLSTAYSLAEVRGRPADLDAHFRDEPFFYGTYVAATVVAAGFVMIPGIPIVPLLFLSQALNALLLLVILPFLRHVAADESVMGEHRLGAAGSATTALVMLGVAASVVTLLVLTIS